MTETKFKKELTDEIKREFPGCMILKNDPSSVQGVPDLTIFHGSKWATLETKKSKSAPHRPNQDYYVKKMNEMSFSSFIYPENKESVLHELKRHLLA